MNQELVEFKEYGFYNELGDLCLGTLIKCDKCKRNCYVNAMRVVSGQLQTLKCQADLTGTWVESYGHADGSFCQGCYPEDES